jgi:hypothetical protein
MNRILGVIVDGDGDFASLKKRFANGYRILKTDGPRGHTAKISDIVARTRKQIGMLRAFSCSRVVVVLDFENRPYSYEVFLRDIRQAFGSYPFGMPVDVVVPNKMIENWYLADIEEISRKKAFIRKKLRQKKYEGKNGKSEIKKCMIRSVAYSETEHGPKMFAEVRFGVAKVNSKSFEEFLEMMDRN